ncbi:MAG: hypothetical protein IPK75_12535 [Acidobacteria bacterium]|nr:hypothetical protein [Acidobacteriota bacterium]
MSETTQSAMRLIAPQDRKAVEAWIGEWATKDEGAGIISSLPSLPRGEGWVWAPELDMLERMRFPLMKTFDSSKAPKRGEARIEAQTLAEVDLTPIRRALEPAPPSGGSAVKPPAKAKPADWQAETDRLVASAREEGFSEGHKKGIQSGIGAGILMAQKALSKLSEKHCEAAAEIAHPSAPPPRKPAVKPPQVPQAAPSSDASLTGPERTLLGALAFWRALGHEQPSRAMVAGVAGWRITSGHLKNVSGSLRTKGMIDYPMPDHIGLTSAGIDAAPEPPEGDPIDLIKPVLSGPQVQVVDTLAQYGRRTRGELCNLLGWNETSGHVKNVLGSLRSLSIVTYPAQGEVDLEGWLK